MINERLQVLRKGRGWTQHQVAQQVGIHKTHISKFEQGTIRPSLRVLMKLAHVYEVSTDFLLFGSGEGFWEEAILSRLRMLSERERQVVFEMLDGWVRRKIQSQD